MGTVNSGRAGKPTLRILVADDETPVLLLLQMQLGRDGHTVGPAENGVDALKLFKSGDWDVVLTDWRMVGMNGEELARQIKELSPTTPVIMISGSLPGRDCPWVDATVLKPFKYSELAEAIERCVGRRQSYSTAPAAVPFPAPAPAASAAE